MAEYIEIKDMYGYSIMYESVLAAFIQLARVKQRKVKNRALQIIRLAFNLNLKIYLTTVREPCQQVYLTLLAAVDRKHIFALNIRKV